MINSSRVVYILREEYGYISSVNEKYIFIKFDKHLRKRNWFEVTAQACHPEDIELISEDTSTIYEELS